MSPYASQLGSHDPVRVLSTTPSRLAELSALLGQERIAESRAPGKWSPREILIHLTDCELAFGFRYRQALAENDHVIQPFDQDLWAKTYAVYSAEQALQTFTALRSWNLALIRSLTPEQLAKPVTHPERGTLVFRTLIEITAGHDINHLRQLEAIPSQPKA